MINGLIQSVISRYNEEIVMLCCIRVQWDILSNGGLVQEMAHIANGRDPGNCVSLLRVNVMFSSYLLS